MKRRGFLGLLAGAAVAPFLPTPKAPHLELPTLPHTFGSFGESPTYGNGLRVGDTITVRLPQRWKATDSLQPYLHEAFTITAFA